MSVSVSIRVNKPLHNVKLIGLNIGVCVGVVTCEQALTTISNIAASNRLIQRDLSAVVTERLTELIISDISHHNKGSET